MSDFRIEPFATVALLYNIQEDGRLGFGAAENGETAVGSVWHSAETTGTFEL
jgi:hypothetical protein